MYRLRNSIGPIAGLLIYGSLASYVWLYADYFCHHQYSIWIQFRWVNNPNYHFSWWWFILALAAFVIGLILEEFRTDNSTFWLISAKLDNLINLMTFFLLGLGVLLGLSYYIGYLIFQHAPNWGAYAGPFWFWQMWWAVLIGWSLVAGVFCLFRRSNIEYLREQLAKDEAEANFLAKIPTDMLIEELEHRQNLALIEHYRIGEAIIQNDLL